MFGGIHNTKGIALLHRLIEDGEFHASHLITYIVGGAHRALNTIRREVTVCAARITQRHRKGTIIIAFRADMRILARMVGYIILAVFSRVVVFVSIDTEDAEITGLTRPHPVVGVTTILTQTLWGSINQTYIVIALIDREEVATSLIESIHFALNSFAAIIDHLHQFQRHRIDGGIGLESSSTFRNGAQDEVGHIHRLDVEEHIEVFVRQLLLKGLCIETILQVVVLGCRMILDGIESAMVVGEHQTIRTNHHTRTETAQLHDGIVQRRIFSTIQFLRREFQTQLTKNRIRLCRQIAHHPHALISMNKKRDKRK